MKFKYNSPHWNQPNKIKIWLDTSEFGQRASHSIGISLDREIQSAAKDITRRLIEPGKAIYYKIKGGYIERKNIQNAINLEFEEILNILGNPRLLKYNSTIEISNKIIFETYDGQTPYFGHGSGYDLKLRNISKPALNLILKILKHEIKMSNKKANS